VTDTEVTIEIETRRWRIRGLDRNTISGVMKVNVLVFHNGRFHVDTLDVYHARSRRSFLAEAADEVGAAEGTLRSDLGRVLLKLEQLQTEQLLSAKQQQPKVKLSDAERTEALALLHNAIRDVPFGTGVFFVNDNGWPWVAVHPGLPQTRTCRITAYGSSSHEFAT
jgi:hypothetical protein